ncbi:serine-rich adhesin for platelets [Toxorhynchites rutilus septentrionalis]|uniref:serine-rich adhesin for platelets n=1 Tax=Toxorhynchites rutilus septentrionalis TaxID=329112 RepID=UPI002478CA4F|nr:serine-rich adhesin for platelets [Toxorhynchites rutilus septentrionalis]XP_055629649.1 serine-rich adhesin for platelets [Toxorhynchites rutilus septentrionalis]XP_055629650.1 serine-rich adhesin for platelets [Toxorhynchites rutilus septentrionalis]XP_055629651.1 serine-rich adhesin for platelets [Toxorhynchites rutilus septentrionalis]XP_055629652.1 serine-rich adhesin for platelets [Toxorhynchites rutilus septentrionalis]XP_055629653.1 serine-rich adhesin for platelets [Toxorhynchites 
MMASFNASDTKSIAPEITAEWTVHAQLKLSHQGSSTTCDKPVAADGCGGGGIVSSEADSTIPVDVIAGTEKRSESSTSSSCQRPPVKVVYKFSTADSSHGFAGTNNNASNGSSGVPTAGGVTFKNVTSTTTSDPAAAASVASAQSSNGDITQPASTGREGPNFLAPPQLFPKCTSTCSIVLTADLVPSPGGGDPIINVHKCASTSNVFNTADKCTIFPEFKPYEAKHVSCQTSDIELNVDKTVQTYGDDLRTVRKKPPEALLSPITSRREEKHSSSTRKISPSPAKIVSPSNTLQSSSHRSSVKDDKKKPRTVHIDVYCTGSDAESSCSDESSSLRSTSSSSSSGSRFDTSHLLEMKSTSNVTHPTIYESEEMKLRHKRAARHEIPRRLQQQQQQNVDQSTLSTIGSLRKGVPSHPRRLLKRCSTKEEINESKKILFSKIFGDQKGSKSFSEMDCVRRDPSGDTVSSGYPFSSRSPQRDVTGSSLSSALAYTSGELDEAAGGSLLKVPSEANVTHSDSFEYENSEDRYRINQMERVWSLQTWKSPSVERRLLELHNPKHRRNSDSDNNCSESDHSFVYDSPTRPHESNHSLNEYSDSSPSTVKSCSNRASSSNADSSKKRILQQALLNANQSGTFPPRIRSPIEGYSSEYLALARRFGSLISGRRKPGVHIGPVRNPECQCEHCRRWVVERDGGGFRERALSVDDIACNIVDMRKALHFRNQAALP